jgi:hypothetical protein
MHNASFGFIDGVHTFCIVDFEQDPRGDGDVGGRYEHG